MMDDPRNDPVLTRFRAAVTRFYGVRIERAVLYGSRARGSHRPDSDYDVALFLHDMPDRSEQMARLAEIETEILYGTGRLINALPFPSSSANSRPRWTAWETRQDPPFNMIP